MIKVVITVMKVVVILESDTGLTIEVNEEKATKNKKKVTTEEIRKVIVKNLLSSDDEKPIKNKKKDITTEEIKNFIENSLFSSGDEKPRKEKRLKKVIPLQVVVMIKITKKNNQTKKN